MTDNDILKIMGWAHRDGRLFEVSSASFDALFRKSKKMACVEACISTTPDARQLAGYRKMSMC